MIVSYRFFLLWNEHFFLSENADGRAYNVQPRTTSIGRTATREILPTPFKILAPGTQSDGAVKRVHFGPYTRGPGIALPDVPGCQENPQDFL
jgi:hypothetical protein